MFMANSWYFRNDLVRAKHRNVAKGIEPTTQYLQLFLRNLPFGEANDPEDRHLHIRWESKKPQNDVSDPLKHHNEISRRLPEGLSLKESAVLKAVMADIGISISKLSATTGLSASAIDRVIKSLKNKHILFRIGSTKQAKWRVNKTNLYR